MKFYEILTHFPKLTESSQTGRPIRSLHLCEAPGAFISALVHYCSGTVYCELSWPKMAHFGVHKVKMAHFGIHKVKMAHFGIHKVKVGIHKLKWTVMGCPNLRSISYGPFSAKNHLPPDWYASSLNPWHEEAQPGTVINIDSLILQFPGKRYIYIDQRGYF